MHGHYLLHFGQHHLPLNGQVHAPGRACELHQREFIFHGLDMRAHSRLAERKDLRGTNDAAFSGDGDERSQLIDLHRHCLNVLSAADR